MERSAPPASLSLPLQPDTLAPTLSARQPTLQQTSVDLVPAVDIPCRLSPLVEPLPTEDAQSQPSMTGRFLILLYMGWPITSALATCVELSLFCDQPGKTVIGLECPGRSDVNFQSLTSIFIIIDVLVNGFFLWTLVERRELHELARWASLHGDDISEAHLVGRLRCVRRLCCAFILITAGWLSVGQTVTDSGVPDADELRPCFVIMLNMTKGRCVIQSIVGGTSDCLQFGSPLLVVLLWIWINWVLQQVATVIVSDERLDHGSVVALLNKMGTLSRRWALVHALRISVTTAWALSILVMTLRNRPGAKLATSGNTGTGSVLATVFGASGYHIFQLGILVVFTWVAGFIAGYTNDYLTRCIRSKMHQSAMHEDERDVRWLALQTSTLDTLLQHEGMRFMGVRMTIARAQILVTAFHAAVYYLGTMHVW